LEITTPRLDATALGNKEQQMMTGQRPQSDQLGAVSTTEQGAAQREGFTPGPWTQDQTAVHAADFLTMSIARCCGERRRSFGRATIPIDYAEREANARLIATAPDMLALLKEIVADALCQQGAPPGVGHLERAEQIIAKATGTEP
jgi:hypothetical protein